LTAEKLYTKNEAAALLHVAPLTLERWLREGKIVGVKVGRKWCVADSDLQAFIEKNRTR